MSGEKIFYDIHLHAFDLSHPCLYAFARRITPVIETPLLGEIAGAITPLLWLSKKNEILNLLSVMERGVGEMLTLLQKDLQIPLRIGDFEYDEVVITPLMMDFWYTLADQPHINYKFIPKSVVPQTLDTLNGIADYWKQNSTNGLKKMRPLPFMGLNTQRCHLNGQKVIPDVNDTKLESLLDKYFNSNIAKGNIYPGTNKFANISNNCGRFNGELEPSDPTNLTNYFAGIKLYPGLGFDPWPTNDDAEMEKVAYLYKTCADRQIPITVHCSDGGYKIGNIKQAEDRTHPRKWKHVLERYENLKINLAHFGGREGIFDYAYYRLINSDAGVSSAGSWTETIAELIAKYENAYTDISYAGHYDGVYAALAKILAKKPNIAGKIMYGSDFSINLLDSFGYAEYTKQFLHDKNISDNHKRMMCNANPAKFLWK
ncbi:MAG: amidohydrolase family protein [Nitrospinae bacterium]|nr:amidohydrolase family protein [Nitrospinota bacterium]